MKIIVYGDIGGHYDALVRSLDKHGVKLTKLGASIPEDTIVIQVGDLIDRGPKSDGLVHAVNNTIYESNPRWIQLFGNHELNVIDPLFSGYEEDTSNESKDKIRSWWNDKAAHMAVGVVGPDRPILITHAGLMSTKWMQMGSPMDLDKLVEALNKEGIKEANAYGQMLSGGGISSSPGVAWASTVNELLASWVWYMGEYFDRDHNPAGVLKEPRMQPPFDMVHGHTSSVWWVSGRPVTSWKLLESHATQYGLTVELDIQRDKRMSVATVDGLMRFFAVDQSLGKDDPSFELEPLVLEGEVVLH